MQPSSSVALVFVVVDECSDLSLEITWQEVVFQQEAVFQSLMPTLDLALRLRTIWRATRVRDTFVPQPFDGSGASNCISQTV